MYRKKNTSKTGSVKFILKSELILLKTRWIIVKPHL